MDCYKVVPGRDLHVWLEEIYICLEGALVIYQLHVSEGAHAAGPDCLCDQGAEGA